MDHFGEQRGEGGAEEDTAETLRKEELMDLGYQPGFDGEEDSNNMDSPHSPGHAGTAPPGNATTRAVLARQTSAHPKVRIGTCQGVPRMPPVKPWKRGEEQPTQLASPQDEHEPAEGSIVSGQVSSNTTSARGDPPSDSQEEVIVHAEEEEIDSLC